MVFDIEQYAEGAVMLDGLEDAILGITEEFGGIRRILYSRPEILRILQERDSMTEEEAYEFYEFNILGLHVSEQNPVFLDLKIKENL